MGKQQLWTADSSWGNSSYGQLIAHANSSDAKQMTVSEIYRWFVENVSYVADKADIPSTTGWEEYNQTHFDSEWSLQENRKTCSQELFLDAGVGEENVAKDIELKHSKETLTLKNGT